MRQHSRDNANCTVSLWDDDKRMWVSKEDTGTESNTEAEKGIASDSFKRACFNWGIGRELYTAPFIWIPAGKVTVTQGRNGKMTTYDKFFVKSIGYSGNSISMLEIVNDKGVTVFTFCKKNPVEPSAYNPAKNLPEAEADSAGNPDRNAATSANPAIHDAFNPSAMIADVKRRFGVDNEGFRRMRQALIDGKVIPDKPGTEMTEEDWRQLFTAIEQNFGDAA